MCGIAGFLELPAASGREALERVVGAMAGALGHRGPDAGAVWSDAEAGLAFGHRRLAVIDLTPTGAQPMTSACGRFVIVYNGEVYNFAELRAELEAAGRRFRGGSDTEVILEGFAAWGDVGVASRLLGMFALAVWDRAERRLTLIRDRLGKKPLYWGRQGRLFLFGSELRALRAHPAFRAEVDRAALAAYLRASYVPAPHAIYRDVRKLEPGAILRLEADGRVAIVRYWELRRIVAEALARRRDWSDDEAEAEFETLARDAVRRRLVADVPLGAFLSGGLDSSLVVALMQAESARPVRTFTVGFDSPGFDESEAARAVARHLGCEHTELRASGADALAQAARLPALFDEPLADPSQIPSLLVAQAARRHVTVALSGDGGDECYAGYNHYAYAERAWRMVERTPRLLRLAAAPALRRLSGEAPLAGGLSGHRLSRLGEVLTREEPMALYRALVSRWSDPGELLPGTPEPTDYALFDAPAPAGAAFDDRMAAVDLGGYLPDDVLAKVDRASMAFGLEVRSPLLDHRLVEFALGLPRRLKVRDGRRKWILRQTLHRFVPRELVERPKTGFAPPIAEWLRGPLRGMAEELLSERALAEAGLLASAPVRRRWAEHLSGRRDWSASLWTVLQFEAWRREWLGPSARAAA